MKYFLSFSLSLLITSFSLSQQLGVHSHRGAESSFIKSLSTSSPDQFFESLNITKEDLKNIVGSPYESDFFQPGNIYKNNELVAPNIPMRYNIFSDEVEINSSLDSDSEDLSVLLKSPFVFVSIANEVYVYIENITFKEESGYFKVLYEGEHYDLYKKSSVTYVEKRFAETAYQQDQPARFDRNDTYFLVNKHGRFFELPSNRRNFLNVFTDHSKDVNSYMREKKLDYRNENDLEKIIKYFNEIL